MAQEPGIEAARTRIQRIVEQIAALSKKEMRNEEFFAQFITHVVEACDAKGGAVWLMAKTGQEGKSEFQLAGEVEFQSSLFQQDEEQRANLLRTLSEVVRSKQPLVFAPAQAQSDPGSLQAQLQQLQSAAPQAEANKAPYPFVHVPLFLKDQVLGVLQIWLQPYVATQNYAEFATFLTSLATYVEQHLHSRRLGSLVMETQRLQHLLKFTSDLAGSLDPLEVARLASNYGRDLVGCERCSVLTLHGGKWTVLSISGQETVENKSSMVKAMSAFVGAHSKPQMVVLSKKELLARASQSTLADPAAPPAEQALAIRRTDDIDLAYFELSHVVSAAMAPLLNSDNELVGVYFAESTGDGFFDTPAGAQEAPAATRITEWLATHTGKCLLGADDYHSLPFLGVTKRLRQTRLLLTGSKRNRILLKTSIIGTVAVIALLYPKLERIDGNCSLVPMHRNAVVTEVAGRIEKVLVKEGERVKKSQVIAQLDTRRIDTEIATNEQEKRRLQADSNRYSGLGDEASAQVATLQMRVTEQNEKKLKADLEAATLRSPIDGVILTKDVELHVGEFIQPGSSVAEVASLDQWEVQIDVNEKQIGLVESTIQQLAPGEHKPVNFILYSQSAHTLSAELQSHAQISASAYPREKENVFIVTLQNISIPEELLPAMRPGLTGRAKIDLARKPLLLLALQRIWCWAQMRMIG